MEWKKIAPGMWHHEIVRWTAVARETSCGIWLAIYDSTNLFQGWVSDISELP